MKAVAITPGVPKSARLIDLPKPRVDEVPHGRGVLVKVLRVGVDGTDKELYNAEYGSAPGSDPHLVVGHESFGIVEAVGPQVVEVVPGDFVVATVRRPGSSIYDAIGTNDMTTDSVYYERGINLLHGLMSEYYVDDAEYIVKVPTGLKEVGVLLEPVSVAEKGIVQAFETQRRLKVWRPRKALVVGAGPLGLLAAMVLRLRGLQVWTAARTRPPSLNAELASEIGARYVSTQETPLAQLCKDQGPFDIIFEASGQGALVFESMELLARNGVLVLTSITGQGKSYQVPGDKINLEFVLGNKVVVGTVNANREYFELGVKDMAHCELAHPGWLRRFLTHPVSGLGNFPQVYQHLFETKGAVKVFCEIAPIP